MAKTLRQILEDNSGRHPDVLDIPQTIIEIKQWILENLPEERKLIRKVDGCMIDQNYLKEEVDIWNAYRKETLKRLGIK